MFWFIGIPIGLMLCVALLAWLHTRRLVLRFNTHLQETRSHLESRFHQRRHLIPSLIALSAGVTGLETECLETLDNATELVIRSHGFDERLIAENRLSSALGYLRNRLNDLPANLPPDLSALLNELDNREAGIAVAGDLYNRQAQEFRDTFTRPPHPCLGPLCGYHPPHPIDIRLSTTTVAPKTRRPPKHEESIP